MVRLNDRPDMTLDVYCGRKTTIQQQQLRARLTQASTLLTGPNVNVLKIGGMQVEYFPDPV